MRVCVCVCVCMCSVHLLVRVWLQITEVTLGNLSRTGFLGCFGRAAVSMGHRPWDRPLSRWPEEPEGPWGSGSLGSSVMTAGQRLGTWPCGRQQLRSASLAGPGHWREDPDRLLD